MQKNLSIIQRTIQNDFYKRGLESVDLNSPWTLEKFTPDFNSKLDTFMQAYRKFYQDIYNKAVAAKEKLILARESAKGSSYNLNDHKNHYYNESLADLVKNVSEKNRLIEYDGQLVQQVNPIYLDAQPSGALDYRAHFFAPKKNLFGMMISTYWFNVLVIWIMSLFLYVTLYFEVVRKFVSSFENITLTKTPSAKKK
jgi:hypothetical protein